MGRVGTVLLLSPCSDADADADADADTDTDTFHVYYFGFYSDMLPSSTPTDTVSTVASTQLW